MARAARRLSPAHAVHHANLVRVDRAAGAAAAMMAVDGSAARQASRILLARSPALAVPPPSTAAQSALPVDSTMPARPWAVTPRKCFASPADSSAAMARGASSSAPPVVAGRRHREARDELGERLICALTENASRSAKNCGVIVSRNCRLVGSPRRASCGRNSREARMPSLMAYAPSLVGSKRRPGHGGRRRDGRKDFARHHHEHVLADLLGKPREARAAADTSSMIAGPASTSIRSDSPERMAAIAERASRTVCAGCSRAAAPRAGTPAAAAARRQSAGCRSRCRPSTTPDDGGHASGGDACRACAGATGVELVAFCEVTRSCTPINLSRASRRPRRGRSLLWQSTPRATWCRSAARAHLRHEWRGARGGQS